MKKKPEHKATKQACFVQAKVHDLKTNRQDDFIKMGGWLRDIKWQGLYKKMKPFFPTWGLYIASEGMSSTFAAASIQAYDRLLEIAMINVHRSKTIRTKMANMPITNMNLLCQLPADDIMELMEQNVHQWTGTEIKNEVRRYQGKSQLPCRKGFKLNKKEALLISDLMQEGTAPRGRKALRKELIERIQHFIVSM